MSEHESGNKITAGAPGEAILDRAIVGDVLIKRLPLDMRAIRVSAGRPRDRQYGAYCVYRGSPLEAIEVLESVLRAMRTQYTGTSIIDYKVECVRRALELERQLGPAARKAIGELLDAIDAVSGVLNRASDEVSHDEPD